MTIAIGTKWEPPRDGMLMKEVLRFPMKAMEHGEPPLVAVTGVNRMLMINQQDSLKSLLPRKKEDGTLNQTPTLISEHYQGLFDSIGCIRALIAMRVC